MKAIQAPGRAELRESRSDVLAGPILFAIVLLAVVVRQFIPPPPSAVVVGVCGALAVLDALLARYLLHVAGASLVVTPDAITFTPRKGRGYRNAQPEVIRRGAGSTLAFRLQSNGFVGDQPQYLLRLRDAASRQEIAATPFGRHAVRQACESQGWTFS